MTQLRLNIEPRRKAYPTCPAKNARDVAVEALRIIRRSPSPVPLDVLARKVGRLPAYVEDVVAPLVVAGVIATVIAEEPEGLDAVVGFVPADRVAWWRRRNARIAAER